MGRQGDEGPKSRVSGRRPRVSGVAERRGRLGMGGKGGMGRHFGSFKGRRIIDQTP